MSRSDDSPGTSTAGAGDGPSVETELDRDIGLVGALALGVGTMIAAGIFVLSGLAVSNVGAAAILAFLIAGIVASFTAFAYAEFASIYPESGGGYMYVANVFDRDWTFIVGWSMILGYPASAAFYLASFSDWFYRFIYPVLDIPSALPYWISGVLVLALLVGVNLKGTEETGLFQIVVTALKVVLIGFFLYGGLQALQSDVVLESFRTNTQTLSDFRNIGLTSALVFITFFGFEAIATNAEEIESPGKTVPRAIFLSMGIVTVIYTLVVLVIVVAVNDPAFLDFLTRVSELGGLTPREFISERGEIAMGRAAQYYLGDVGFYVIIVGALFSMLSAANATILAGSRVKLAMARRDHLPSQFEDLHDSLNTPYKAVVLTGGLILLYIAVFSVVFGEHPGEGAAQPPFGLHLGVEALAHFADFMLLGGLIAVNLAIVVSRKQSPDIDRGFEVPAVPYVPAIAVLANFVLLVNVSPTSFAIGLVAEVLGIAFWYTVLAGSEQGRADREAPTVAADHEVGAHEYTLAVPLANPSHVEPLMDTAIDIASERDAEILVTSVVEVPAQTPLSRGRDFVPEQREVVDDAMTRARDAGIPVSGVVRLSHQAGPAIVHTLDQHDVDAALLGWRGRPHRRRDVILGTTVDHVVQDAPCDVLVERVTSGQQTADIDRILLPTAGGPHAEFAADVASAIGRANDATLDVVHVVDPDASEGERETARDHLQTTTDHVTGIGVEQRLLEGHDVVERIVDETGAFDLTLIGATREPLLEQLVFGNVPESVGEHAQGTVIMAKRNLDITSWLKRWLGRFGVGG